MSLTVTKTDAKKLYDILENPPNTIEEMAYDILVRAFAIYEGKAKWAVVGQLYRDNTGVRVHGEVVKAHLGCFTTERQAEQAGRSLAYSSQSGEEWRWWKLPIHAGTPAGFHKERKEQRQDEAIDLNARAAFIAAREIERLQKKEGK